MRRGNSKRDSGEIFAKIRRKKVVTSSKKSFFAVLGFRDSIFERKKLKISSFRRWVPVRTHSESEKHIFESDSAGVPQLLGDFLTLSRHPPHQHPGSFAFFLCVTEFLMIFLN